MDLALLIDAVRQTLLDVLFWLLLLSLATSALLLLAIPILLHNARREQERREKLARRHRLRAECLAAQRERNEALGSLSAKTRRAA